MEKLRDVWLSKRNQKDLDYGSPECIWRASNGCGVFESEESFLLYLRRYYSFNHKTNYRYLGTKDENQQWMHRRVGEPIEVYMKNYTITNHKSSNAIFTADKLPLGAMAVVTSAGDSTGDLVFRLTDRLQNLTAYSAYWTEDGMKLLEVRLLEPGEEFIIRGR